MTQVISIDALIFLDSKNGSRFFAKHYAESLAKKSSAELLAYEKRLFEHFNLIVDEMKDGGERTNRLI